MKCSITSLGGIGEIGMNLYIFETDTSAIIVDCGVKFADADDPAIDLIIPDFKYLDTIKHKLQCVFITHAHEDHIGALPFLMKRHNMPIAASKYTLGLINHKLKDHGVSAELTDLSANVPVEAGDFIVTFIPISHSIHGTGALFIETSDGFTCLHMSDYKIDFAPHTCVPFDHSAFLHIGDSGLNCLLADSTSCLDAKFTKGETSVISGIDDIFSSSDGRIFFTTFSSNVERLQTVFDLAVKHNRKVAIEGSSIIKHINNAREMGLLRIKEDTVISRKSIERLPDCEVCVIATGSQGERNSVISKIAKDDYAKITVRPTDTFVFSSRIIPGNEKLIIQTMNNISMYGARCITVKDANIHVSGHASKYDAELLLKLTRPDYLIPVHGERIHLLGHKNLAVGLGMEEENVIVTESGKSIVFEDGVLSEIVAVETGKLFIDNKNGYELTLNELKARKRLSTDGVVFLIATVDLERGRIHNDIDFAFAGCHITDDFEKTLTNAIIENSETSIFERFNNDAWVEWLDTLISKQFKRYFTRKPIIKIKLKHKPLIETDI